MEHLIICSSRKLLWNKWNVCWITSLSSQRKKVIALIEAKLLAKLWIELHFIDSVICQIQALFWCYPKSFLIDKDLFLKQCPLKKLIDGFKGLRVTLLSLNSRTAPGAGGLKGMNFYMHWMNVLKMRKLSLWKILVCYTDVVLSCLAVGSNCCSM